MMARTGAVLLCVLMGSAVAVSPVQKVVELLEECKGKVKADLEVEAKAMEEYTTFCDDELKDKGYAIETAGRAIEDLSATVEDSTATISELDDQISTLGTTIAGKQKELDGARAERQAENADFQAAEKELVKSVDELGRAGTVLKRGLSFAQMRGGKKALNAAVAALSSIVEASWIDIESQRHLKSLLQASTEAADTEDDDLELKQPQAKQVAYESTGGAAVLKTIEEMQGKAEDALSELRKKEMENQHSFENIENGLNNELKNDNDKLATAKKDKAAAEQALEEANGKNVETKKSKAADEAYAATLKGECEAKAAEWAARQKSATEELGAIDKAKEILVSGVKAFVQVSVKTHRRSGDEDSDEDSDAADAMRQKVVDLLKGLNEQHHSYRLMQLASRATSDPFVKIRGLIEDMIDKLLKEAQEEATHEAFCQEEMGKSNKAKEDKTMKMDKYKARTDMTATTIAELTESVKTLESEIAEIDKAQSEATAMRTKEHDEYLKASKDFKDSGEAVAKAIEVLKNFYEGALIQVSATTHTLAHMKARQPELGGAKSDTASTIISVLEMSEEDFTTLLAEAEETEADAAKKYEELTSENKVSKATKMTDAKAKQSNVKSLKVQLEHSEEDYASVGKELDAVNSYLDKLKPECESKAMSYEEKKAAREAEIDGLKEALTILSGEGIALAQTSRSLRQIHRA